MGGERKTQSITQVKEEKPEKGGGEGEEEREGNEVQLMIGQQQCQKDPGSTGMKIT